MPSHVALNAVVQPGREVEAERVVRVLEAAATEAAQHHVAAAPKDHEIEMPVAVDVDGVCARDCRQIGDRRRDRREAKGSADGAVVVEKRRGVAAASEEQLVTPVVIAVECGDSATHEVLELPVVLVGDAGRGCVIDEMGRGSARRASPSTCGHEQ